MSKKKLVTALTISAMMVLSLGSVVAEANNHADEPFKFTFNTTTYQTESRSKTDTSSSYMKCNQAGKSYTAHVYGWYRGETIDCSYGHSYVFSTGTTKFMLNDVYEKGYRSSGIEASRNYAGVYTASGVWSPDSV